MPRSHALIFLQLLDLSQSVLSVDALGLSHLIEGE